MKILNVAKLALYGIFLNYYCYYVLAGSFIPGGTILFLALALLCVGVDVLNRRYLYVGKEIKCWIVYAVLSFITTGFITIGSGNSGYVQDIFKFAQRLLIIMMVAYICERENSVRFGLRLMAVTAIACSVSILMVVGDIQQKLNVTSGANLSDNDVASIMTYGCFVVFYAFGKRGRASLLLSSGKAAAAVTMMIVIFLAGSRKSIGGVILMVVLLLMLWVTDYHKHANPRMVFSILIVAVITYLVVNRYLLPYMEQTNLYTRLFGRGAEGASQSDKGRVDLYVWAIQDFLNHPIVGLGFNQFTEVHGNYTHSTYVEPLACSGLIGLLYLYPYYSIVRKQLYLIRRSRPGSLARLKQKEIFVYLCIALFIAVGIPYMYKDIPCILLGTFIASQTISFRELMATGRTSEDY